MTDSPIEVGFRRVIREELQLVVPEAVQRALADAGNARAFTSVQLAEQWSCSRASIDKLIASGELRSVDGPGRARLVRAADAAEYLERKASHNGAG